MDKVQEVPVLIEKLRNSCVEFIALSPLGQNTCDFLFCGPFSGKTVLWQTRLQVSHHRESGPQQSIDIHAGSEPDTYQVTVNLNIPRITQGDVLKTIMMIRQYKKLRLGVHVFSG